MADDIKLQLGIDMEGLQRAASQATNVLAQSFEKGVSSNLLGNGLLPTQISNPIGSGGTGPAAQLRAIAGVITAVQQVNNTLIAGFTALSGGAYLGGGQGGAGGIGGAGGGAVGGGSQPAPQPAPGRRRSAFVKDVVQGLTTGVNAVGAFVNSGGSSQGTTNLIGAAGSMLLPEVAPLINAITSVVNSGFDKRDLFREAALRRFQVGGGTGIDIDEGKFNGQDFADVRKGMGFSIGQFTDLYTSASKRGVFDRESAPQSVMFDLMRGENAFGNSNSMMSMLGAAGRTGSKTSSEEVIGAAFSAAMEEGLTKGRIGEIYDKLADAIDKNTVASTDVSATANRFLFISQLGPQFRGDTIASRDMDQTIKGLAAGSTGFTQMTSLLTAGMGAGKSYAQARLALDTGVDTVGGVSSDALVQSNYAPFVDAYANADESGKASILLQLSVLLGGSLTKHKLIMDKLSSGNIKKVDAAAGYKRFGEISNSTPSAITTQRVTPAVGQDVWRFGIGDTSSAFERPDASSSSSLTSQSSSSAFPSLQSSTQSSQASSAQQSYGSFVTQKFGNPIPGRAPHPGVDLALPPGTSVTCPVDGVIEDIRRGGTGLEVGDAIHIRASDGVLWKIYHIDPNTFSSGLRVGQRITKGTPLGRTYSIQFWQGPNGQRVRTHLHVGQTGAGGVGLDPMRPGGIAPGALTGGDVDAAAGVTSRSSPAGASSSGAGPGSPGNVHVTTDVNVYVHQDPSGRTVVRARAAAPSATSSPGQLVGGTR